MLKNLWHKFFELKDIEWLLQIANDACIGDDFKNWLSGDDNDLAFVSDKIRQRSEFI